MWCLYLWQTNINACGTQYFRINTAYPLQWVGKVPWQCGSRKRIVHLNAAVAHAHLGPGL